MHMSSFLGRSELSSNAASCKVCRVECRWDAIFAHVLRGDRDALDIYIRQTGLHLVNRPLCQRVRTDFTMPSGTLADEEE